MPAMKDRVPLAIKQEFGQSTPARLAKSTVLRDPLARQAAPAGPYFRVKDLWPILSPRNASSASSAYRFITMNWREVSYEVNYLTSCHLLHSTGLTTRDRGRYGSLQSIQTAAQCSWHWQWGLSRLVLLEAKL